MSKRWIIILAVLLLMTVLVVHIKPLYEQEGNPLPFLYAALHLSSPGNGIEPVTGKVGTYLIRSGDGFGPIIAYLEQQGWQYQEQMGAGLLFYKDGLGLTAVSRSYSRFFTIVIIPSSDQTPEPSEFTCVTLTATGDILMHNTVIASGLKDGQYNFDHLYAPVKHWLEAADYASVSLESPLAGPSGGYTGYPLFNSPDTLADTLKNSGFDLVVTANNHILDRGLLGALRTMDVLQNAGLDITGTFRSSEEQHDFLIKDIRGVKIGYLAYGYGTNGIPVPAGHDYFYNFLDKEKILADIAALRPQVDVLVLVLHWGVEYSPLPTAEQRSFARDFLTKGADVILGSHPHVIQPLEIMNIDGKEKLVIYSMGNSIGDQNGIERNSGLILSLQFTKDLQTGVTTLSGYSYIPTYIQEYFVNGRRTFRVLSIEEAIAAIKNSQDPYLDAQNLPVLEKAWADIDAQVTRPLP